MRIPILLCIVVCCAQISVRSQAGNHSWLKAEPETVIPSEAGDIPVVAFEGLKPLFEQADGKVRVVNFWATWCAPCIKELPHFEALQAELADRGVEVTLVSLDFPNAWEKRLPEFISRKNLRSPVVVLNDPRQNDWIPQVSESWSGAIPATLIYSADRREFYEQTFDGPDLRAAVETFLSR